MAVVSGLIIASCGGSGSSSDKIDKGFEATGMELLDYNYWQGINEPAVMGPNDMAVLAVGKGGYTDPKVYKGEVVWTVYPVGVVKFVAASNKTSPVADDGDSAVGNVVSVIAVAEGEATVTARDVMGNTITHGFKVGEGQHYSPDATWDDEAAGDKPEDSSSSSSYSSLSSSSSSAAKSSSSSAAKSSSSSAAKSSSSSAAKSSSSSAAKSSSSSAAKSSSSSAAKSSSSSSKKS